ncbi:hypothetical protein [Leifsonia shinshuensis]|uniref:Uncharacterized protein n=1 Tax=Leifsonia shinshuensis TaxID=150026 RepID=A0A853CVK2_9MICO|nr:hypothetical protein [Leifsonia shinshuensis]NYJ24452.1 hypothetical protein [Leifsonia shinshuensis]
MAISTRGGVTVALTSSQLTPVIWVMVVTQAAAVAVTVPVIYAVAFTPGDIRKTLTDLNEGFHTPFNVAVILLAAGGTASCLLFTQTLLSLRVSSDDSTTESFNHVLLSARTCWWLGLWTVSWFAAFLVLSALVGGNTPAVTYGWWFIGLSITTLPTWVGAIVGLGRIRKSLRAKPYFDGFDERTSRSISTGLTGLRTYDLVAPASLTTSASATSYERLAIAKARTRELSAAWILLLSSVVLGAELASLVSQPLALIPAGALTIVVAAFGFRAQLAANVYRERAAEFKSRADELKRTEAEARPDRSRGLLGRIVSWF